MDRSHKKPAQTHTPELSDLVAGAARIIGTRANDLQAAARKLPCGTGILPVKTRSRSTIGSELQASFQALAQCALLVEAETERFRRITRTTPHKAPSENDTHTSSDTL